MSFTNYPCFASLQALHSLVYPLFLKNCVLSTPIQLPDIHVTPWSRIYDLKALSSFFLPPCPPPTPTSSRFGPIGTLISSITPLATSYLAQTLWHLHIPSPSLNRRILSFYAVDCCFILPNSWIFLPRPLPTTFRLSSHARTSWCTHQHCFRSKILCTIF